jgi:putative hydrolase of the HAD superfamily
MNDFRDNKPHGGSPARDRIEVVFFDAAGTLFEVRGSVGEIYARFARRHGVDLSPGTIQSRFIRSFSRRPPLAFPAGTPEPDLFRLERGWWRDLVLDVFDDSGLASFDEFFAEVFEFFREAEAWVVFDDTVPALDRLRSSGCRLGVISNFDSRLFDLLRNLKLNHHFDSIHISARVGAAKPDPAIFRAALNHHAVEPHRALHVGDCLREDVDGASAAGMRAVWIDRDLGIEAPVNATRITRLDLLFDMIDG